MSLPRIKSYKGHPNANAMRVEIGGATLWFSYETLVAFRTPSSGLVVRRNAWGPTTGKHLNMIEAQGGAVPGRCRLDCEEFREAYEAHVGGTLVSL